MNNETLIITEANYKTKRNFQCPYCDYKGQREDLVDHIEKKHPNEIPEDWTAARVVYKVVNGKDHGECMVCGVETQWNEDRWKYDKLCGDPKCTKELADRYAARTKGKYGDDYNIYKDPEHQKKMLEGRRISGKYKFRDGGEVSFVGEYERARLEFMDKTMNYKSWEIMSPGPTIEYIFDGKKHFWITDCYILSHNLVIDDKDGEDNPNQRNMGEYRKKQLAKEKAIKDQKQYNYLRLTNKNFSQLLYALADIKVRMIDDMDNKKPHETYSYVNENAAIMGAFPPDAAQGSHVMITPFVMNNVFGGEDLCIGVSKGSKGNMIFVGSDGKLKKKKAKEIYENCAYKAFSAIASQSSLEKINEAYESQETVTKFFIYETITGKHLYDLDQLEFDPVLESIDSEKFINGLESIEEASLRREAYIVFNGTDFAIDIFTESELFKAKRLLNETPHLIIKQDPKGYFAINEETGKRTGSYSDIDSIPRKLLKFI